MHREWVHRTARGERLLVVHGDQFDSHMEHACPRWMSWLGNALYDFTVMANDRVNDVGRVLGRPYWPLAEKLKLSVERRAALHRALRAGCRGLRRRARFRRHSVRAHPPRQPAAHRPTRSTATPGDWVETCSAMVEEPGGELRCDAGHMRLQPHVDSASGSVMVRRGWSGAGVRL